MGPRASSSLKPDAILRARAPKGPGSLFVDAGSLARPGHEATGEAHDLATYAAIDLERREVELHALLKPPQVV
ncbi:MAG: hypothetical protein JKY65_19895 [Planctomycetes bacterium]|nr:hypothetical protein [Planctomycetota bacterium]